MSCAWWSRQALQAGLEEAACYSGRMTVLLCPTGRCHFLGDTGATRMQGGRNKRIGGLATFFAAVWVDTLTTVER